MLMRTALTALFAAAAAGALMVPAAAAAEADPADYVIESANGTERVWQQTWWDGEPTITADFHGTDNQHWIFWGNRTIQNAGTDLCATADHGRIIGADCNGDDPGQRWTIRGDHNQKLLRNEETGNCATYEGLEDQLTLHTCDVNRINQRWYLNI
ncbi:RICIN domain-containing protein [Amycolatopsis sp. CA-128772]|uniref:RICIN domain-containing protein n=1 Tax=Amycolatopsis sp. CA-128772 TaxID=2073159 RepID=UPI000CD2B06F|nr:RICIN domain-containing protein [Amycolatopsis sp. CA-128772]